METINKLTSAEIGILWSHYISDSMAKCIFKYFLQHIEDGVMRPTIEFALAMTEENTKKISQAFKSEGIPIPVGFREEDVNLDAPRLYSDIFYLRYIKQISKIALTTYGFSLSLSVRSDIHNFYSENLISIMELDKKVNRILLLKGLFIHPPYISVPEKVDFVHKTSYLGGPWGNKRTLNAIEITHLFANIQMIALGRDLLIGFSQVAQSSHIRDFCLKGKEMAKKHLESYSSILAKDDLPVPVSWDTGVSNSTKPPFSDKLMLFHINLLASTAIGNYGIGAGTSARTDIIANYVHLIMELLKYAEDGAKIMIKKGWLEEPPQADDRDKLAKCNALYPGVQ